MRRWWPDVLNRPHIVRAAWPSVVIGTVQWSKKGQCKELQTQTKIWKKKHIDTHKWKQAGKRRSEQREDKNIERKGKKKKKKIAKENKNKKKKTHTHTHTFTTDGRRK